MSESQHDEVPESEVTLLPHDPAIEALAERGRDEFGDVLRAHPSSPLVWALLAEGSLLAGTPQADIAGYAYARTGYQRGMEALSAAGWNAGTAIPWHHLPNEGFLRCLWALGVAAGRLGEESEHQRCADFLDNVAPEAREELADVLSYDPGEEDVEEAGDADRTDPPQEQ